MSRVPGENLWLDKKIGVDKWQPLWYNKEKRKEVNKMKATGIIRRIDELGRIVVPKEIRRNLGIKEGDPMEIFTTREGEIVLKPYQEEGSKVVDNFIETFKEMNAEDKKAIVKMLVDEMG
jgi:AbrB family looped-hinge helix DNA binding protein